MTSQRILLLLALCLPAVGRAEGLLPPLNKEQIEQARKILADFKSNPKGPYLRIRWFCKDGTVLPPGPPPCGSRGGGNEHAELSAAGRKLAAWNLDVDTVLTGVGFEQFLDSGRDYHRLKELVLEAYLVDVDQGWIYRRAQFYRGARQVEDEEKVGRALLAQLLSDPAWVSRNYFLANQVARAVPHGARSSTVDKVRALAKSIADRDRRFEPIRVRIHNAPGPDDLPAVENFMAERSPAEAVKTQLMDLAGLLQQQQANRSLAAQLPAYQKKLAGSPLAAGLTALAAAVAGGNTPEIITKGAALSFDIRRQVTASADGRRNLDLLDLNALLLESGFRAGAGGSAGSAESGRADAAVSGGDAAGRRAANAGRGLGQNATRRQLLDGLLDNARYAVGAGLLSMREFEALRGEIEPLEKSSEIGAEAYYQSIRYLARSAEWCRATGAKDFGPVARLYEPVEPATGGLVDQLVRSSVALPLAGRIETLLADANRAVGIRHSILGEASSRGIVGLNPGVALGRLGIIKVGEEDTPVDPRGIYVIPETVADIQPMAGILTLDSGNALSHAQLLAANLGIPNATVPSALLPLLSRYAGQELFFAVTPRRVVVLEQRANLNEAERKLWAERPAANKARFNLDTSRVNLSDRRILDLTDLSAKDAGVKAGPKAANLAQLAHYFPENVAPGLVIPFGIYYEHIDRALDGSGVTLRQQISDAYAQAERMREAGASPAEIGRFINPKLAQFRKAIESMPLLPAFEKELRERMRAKFGPEGTYGLFVRSDTNAEDLPDFAGAGLNLTVPNQVGMRNVVQSLKDVWASPFTERAYDWRSRILRSSEHVYPSVVLLRTVASEKSGVIGTMNLETGNTDEITVNVNEGISAVVDGGVAESLLLKPNGEVRLLDQARAPYKKVALPGGGLENRPSSGDDYVLQPGEIAVLRKMVAQVKARYPPAKNASGQTLPWDIEFGFEKGQFRLFQIRPLVRYQELKTLQALSRLEGAGPAGGMVGLEDRP